MSNKENPIKVILGDEIRTFRNPEDLGSWVGQEFSVWGEFAQSADKNNTPVHGRDKQKNHANQFRNQFSEFKSSKEDADRRELLKKLITNIETRCSQAKDRYIPSDSPRGQHVLRLGDDPEQIDLAAATLSYFVGYPIPQQNITSVAVSGLLEGAMFDKGTTKNVESERRALRKLRNDWDAKFSEDDERNASTLADANAIKNKLLRYQEDEKTAFNAALNAARNRLSELEDLFFNKIQVDASKSYWAARARSARNSFALWMTLLGSFGLLFAIMFTRLVDNAVQSGAAGEAALLKYGSLLVFAIIGIGGFRLIAKMMVSALHVSHEASERVTMIQTYLALLAENSAVAEEERSLILPTLFRPGSTGLLGEEPKSELPLETMLRMLARRQQ